MDKHDLNPGKSLHTDRSKDKKFASQLTKVREYLKLMPASRYMAAVATSVPLQNVCRYVEMLKAYNSIAVVNKGYCRISGELVEYLSTDPALFPKDSQLTLWEG